MQRTPPPLHRVQQGSLSCGMQAMAGELQALRRHSTVVEPGQFSLPGRRATTAVTVAAHLLRGFL